MEKFSIEKCFQASWELFKKRSWFFIGFTASIFAISFVVNLITSTLTSSNDALPHLVSFAISLAFSIAISFAQTRFYLRAHDQPQQVRFSDSWSGHKLWPYALLYVILSACILIGFILLIVPGVILMLVWMFSTYILLDSDRTWREAFAESRRITKGHRWELFLFVLALLVLNILGVIALLVGLLVTIPVSMLATVHAYRSLEKIAPKTSIS